MIIRRPRAVEVLARLAADVDIVVANLPPRALEKIGLDWPTFSRMNPRGILVTQSSFGSDGPDRDKAWFRRSRSGDVWCNVSVRHTGTARKSRRAVCGFLNSIVLCARRHGGTHGPRPDRPRAACGNLSSRDRARGDEFSSDRTIRDPD